MRCGCCVCGTYMIQSERGLLSGCVCPACGNMCTACMGTGAPPLSVEELKARVQAPRADEEPDDAARELPDPPEGDWRKRL